MMRGVIIGTFSAIIGLIFYINGIGFFVGLVMGLITACMTYKIYDKVIISEKPED